MAGDQPGRRVRRRRKSEAPAAPRGPEGRRPRQLLPSTRRASGHNRPRPSQRGACLRCSGNALTPRDLRGQQGQVPPRAPRWPCGYRRLSPRGALSGSPQRSWEGAKWRGAGSHSGCGTKGWDRPLTKWTRGRFGEHLD